MYVVPNMHCLKNLPEPGDRKIRWADKCRGVADRLLAESVPQPILMGFVHKNKNLRWIKCDLTPANVAVMKAERPKVTFISSHLEM